MMHNVWIFVTTPWWHLSISIIYLVVGVVIAACFIGDESYHKRSRSKAWDRYIVEPMVLTFLWVPIIIAATIVSAFGEWYRQSKQKRITSF